jgi:hypothetical protein
VANKPARNFDLVARLAAAQPVRGPFRPIGELPRRLAISGSPLSR